MKRVWATWLAAAAVLLAAEASQSQPGGRFQERLRAAERRFVPRKTPAPAPRRKAAPRKPAPPARSTARSKPRPRPVARRTPRPPAEVARNAAPRPNRDPVLLMTQKVSQPTVTYSFEPRMPTTRMPSDTGDVLFSTFPLGVKVYFEFERGNTSSTRGVLIEGLEPQELHVRASAPSLNSEIETVVPIQAGKMTQAQFFFPERPKSSRTAH